jgi:hypothetical protein
MTMLYNPNLKGLCAEIRQLRESVLLRAAAIGCEIDEASLPEAETIVDGKIGEFLSREPLQKPAAVTWYNAGGVDVAQVRG